MPKQGEVDYCKNIGADGVRHAINKPFSDDHCPFYLMELGAMMTFLPKPPARLLDLGCGTGWTSLFLAKMGYDVTGVDICEDMIIAARGQQERQGVPGARFRVSDYEQMSFDGEFDCAIFFDSLHHAENEETAIASTFRALKPHGVCITSEPGAGHETALASIEAVKKYYVTERDMPPRKIIAAGKKAGFRTFFIYPHTDLIKLFYEKPFVFDAHILDAKKMSGRSVSGIALTLMRINFYAKYLGTNGITILIK